MIRLPGIYKDLWMLSFPLAFYALGAFIDRKESERMSMFRDKSFLYGRELKPGEKPSWPQT